MSYEILLISFVLCYVTYLVYRVDRLKDKIELQTFQIEALQSAVSKIFYMETIGDDSMMSNIKTEGCKSYINAAKQAIGNINYDREL